jgi:hypothetical protein
MDIKNINGDYIKIGKTSITVKKEDIPKTKGVITNCTIITKNCSPRIVFEVHQKLSKFNLRIVFDKMILNNGDLYYLYDLSLEDFVNQNQKHIEHLKNDIEHIEEEKKLCEKMTEAGVNVIKCRILK